MSLIKKLFSLLVVISCICNYCLGNQQKPRNYYLSNTGNDKNNGSTVHPWQTIDKLNRTFLQAGDTVFFKGGETFAGHVIIDSSKTGRLDMPLVITSFGSLNATIDGQNTSGLTVNAGSFIKISNLNFMGSGRKNGNTQNGVAVLYSHDIALENMNIKGFQKAGLFIYSSMQVNVMEVYAHNNGSAGISIEGEYQKRITNKIYLSYCKADNNPGDPTNFTNHSGNGIIAGNCKNVVIEYCSATNNGWDMPRTGNGPVGIWCYEADSVIIQHCISYKNKTSKGGGDGGGFDLDGGVTHSIIQYCLSYENEGSGFGIFQYAGAGNWHDNTIRFCISENDGAVSPAGAGVFIWNSSGDTARFKNCNFYNNTIYNQKAAAISYDVQSEQAGFHFYNNLFIAKDSIITGKEHTGVFLGNVWYSLQSGFNVAGIRDFKKWLQLNGKEQLNDQIMGWNMKPSFTNPGNTMLTEPRKLHTFYHYRLQKKTALKGINLQDYFQLDNGGLDFNGLPITANQLGACGNEK